MSNSHPISTKGKIYRDHPRHDPITTQTGVIVYKKPKRPFTLSDLKRMAKKLDFKDFDDPQYVVNLFDISLFILKGLERYPIAKQLETFVTLAYKLVDFLLGLLGDRDNPDRIRLEDALFGAPSPRI